MAFDIGLMVEQKTARPLRGYRYQEEFLTLEGELYPNKVVTRHCRP